MVEGARLESVYTPKGYRGFESLSLRSMEEKFFVYILQSMKDFSFYVGQCVDLDRRMSKHWDGLSKYTASKRPWRLVYFEMFASRTEAIHREKEIKRKKSKKYIAFLVQGDLPGVAEVLAKSGFYCFRLSFQATFDGNISEIVVL